MYHKSKLLIKKKKSKIFYRSIIFKKSCLYNEIFEKGEDKINVNDTFKQDIYYKYKSKDFDNKIIVLIWTIVSLIGTGLSCCQFQQNPSTMNLIFVIVWGLLSCFWSAMVIMNWMD